MTTQYITKFVNEYGQVNTYEAIEKAKELYKFRLYNSAKNILAELIELNNGTEYDNVNNDLFFLTFDEECEANLYMDRINKKELAQQEAKQARREAEQQDAETIAEAKTEDADNIAYNNAGAKVTQYGKDFFEGYYIAGEDKNGERFYNTARTISELCILAKLSHTALIRDVKRIDYR